MGTKEKLKKFICNHKNIITAIAVNALFFIILSFLNGFRYELSDDWFFSSNIANGNYNFVFCNYFIQLISGLVQKLIYPVNAFMLLQLIFGFIALTSISYIFLDSFRIKKGIFIVLFIQSAFAINVYSLITFTKTAAVLLTAGGLMIFWANLNKKHIGYFIFGSIMAILGSFYRYKIFYSVIAVFAFFILAYVLFNIKPPYIKSFFRNFMKFFEIKTLSVLVLLVVAVFSLNSVSRTILAKNTELDYYREYNSARSSVVDYRLTPFYKAPEEYEAMDVSENDLEMLRKWYLDDEGLAKTDNLKKISKMRMGRYTNGFYLLHMLDAFLGKAETTLFAAYILTAAVMLIVYKKKALAFICPITLAIGLLYLYLFILGRCNYRTAFGIWFVATVLLLYSIKYLSDRKDTKEQTVKMKHIYAKAKMLIFGLVCVLFVSYGILVACPDIDQTDDKDYPELESYIESSENCYFALGRNPYLDFRNATQLDNALILVENKAFDKCVYFGTPYYAHPFYNQILENAGIDNLYTDLADKENLYFVDRKIYGDVENMLVYLNEQYGQDKIFDAQEIKRVDDYIIYKISSYSK